MSSKNKTQKKSKAEKAAQQQGQPASTLATSTKLKHLGRAAALLLIAGFASPVSQLNLSPVYGSIPASAHHQRCMQIFTGLALLSRYQLRKYVSSSVADYIAVIAYWAPVVQYLLFQYSADLGIVWGPMIIEGLTYFPLLFLSVYAAADLMDYVFISRFGSTSPIKEVVPVVSYFAVSNVAKLSSALIPSFIGTSIYFTRIGLQMLVGSASAFLSPSRVILLAFPAILHTLWANPHHPSTHGFQLANSTLMATEQYTLLARHESLTGYLSVIENHVDNAFRLLRCDHSLLGGEWLVTPEAHRKGQRKPETIFAVFVLLEAVRLIEPAATSPLPPKPDSQKSALVIGLGIGTAPNALIAHGINTTIVELDPVVHYYATRYFSLSPNHTAVITNAVSYVADTAVSNPASFDHIIHDVFTGGAEPVALFTTHFIRGLHTLLTPDGTIAINYAGDLSLGSTKLVLNTITSIFPSCRIFRDAPAPSPSPGPDFVNMVIFCVKRETAAPAPSFSFRPPTPADLLGSIARRNFLEPQAALEITGEYVRGEEVLAGEGALERYQRGGAVSHWRIMRSVLPKGVWEMW